VSRLEQAARTGAAATLVLALLLVVQRVAFSPAGRVILQDGDAPWIEVALPVTAEVHQWGREKPERTEFRTGFFLETVPAAARLRLRAFGTLALRVNGVPAALPAEAAREGRRWQRWVETDVAAALHPGANELAVEVANAHGPALLALRLQAGGTTVATGSGWEARLDGGPPLGTVRASDVRPLAESLRGERPLAALAAHAGWPLAGFVLGAAGFLLLRGRLGARAPVALLALATLAWIALGVRKLVGVDLSTGFDARHHLAYLEIVRQQGRIPLATEGWSTYHPPLFYLASAAVAALGGWIGAPEAWSLKLLPFAAGLGNVFLALGLARRLLPGSARGAAVAVAFAGVLPMNAVAAAYFSNEGLHAFLAGAALLVTVECLLAERTSSRRLALLSTLLGLALLTKFTALVVAALSLLFVGARALAEPARGGARRAAELAALALPMLALAGWFYARNVLHFGTPLAANWDLQGPSLAWWSPPGFHTPAYYLGFGASLAHPWLSGFHSFWDALYSSFWGDGFLGGRAAVWARPGQWRWSLMEAGYPLALPATGILLAGLGLAARDALVDPEPRRRAALAYVLAVPGALFFGIFFTTLSLPYVGQAKSFYALASAPALAFFFARGFEALDDALARHGGPAAQAALHGYLGALCVVLYGGLAG